MAKIEINTMNTDNRSNEIPMDVTMPVLKDVNFEDEMPVLKDVNFEDEMLDQQTVFANTLVPLNEGDFSPCSFPTEEIIEYVSTLWDRNLNDDIANNDKIGKSSLNIEELEAKLEISENFRLSNEELEVDKNSSPLQPIAWQHEHTNIGQDFLHPAIAGDVQKNQVYPIVSNWKEIPSTSYGLPRFPTESTTEQPKDDLLAWQHEHTNIGKDFLPPFTADAVEETTIVSSNTCNSKIVQSTSSGEPQVKAKPKLALSMTNSKTSTKRGRPSKELVAPTKETLDQLSEEEQKILIKKYKNNAASRQSRQKKKVQELQNEDDLEMLLKKNENLTRQKEILDKHLKLLELEHQRVFK